jgi:hypothetical protein
MQAAQVQREFVRASSVSLISIASLLMMCS